MPNTSKRIQNYQCSEESEEILSRIPSWLSKSLPIFSLIIYLFGFFLWMIFGLFRNDNKQMTIRLYPRMEKLKLNSFSRIDKIIAFNDSKIKQGDTLICFTDINTRKREVLLASTSGKFKFAVEMKPGDVFEANQILGTIAPADVKYMAYGKLNLKDNQDDGYIHPGKTINLRYDSLLVEAKIAGISGNQAIYALNGREQLINAFMTKDSIQMDMIEYFSISQFLGL